MEHSKTITLESSNYDSFLTETNSKFESIIIKTNDNLNLNNLNVENLNKIFNKISLNGTIELIFSDKNETNDLKANLRFAGFSNVKIIVGNNQYSLKGKKKSSGNNEEKSSNNQTNMENKQVENSWKVVSKVDTLDKINENDLIDPNNIYQQFSKEANCMTKPKPCKNCSCSRKFELDQNGGKDEGGADMKSDCGKCYLGDAFRCEGCPYRGLQAFEPGQKITMKNNDGAVVLNMMTEDQTSEIKVVPGTKVKLDL